MLLRPGLMEFGPRRSALERTWFDTGEMGLCKRQTFAANVRIDPDARVTSPADSVSSGFLQAASRYPAGLPQTPPGTSPFRITFSKAGVYPYICALHDRLGVKGQVTVRP